MLQRSMTHASLSKSDDYRFTTFDFALYAAIIFAWSTSWYPLKLQVGIVAPEVSLSWRFLAASSLMFAFLAITGRQIRFPFREHVRFALLGILIFSSNFLLFYYASSNLASGLLSVIFSTASIFSLILSTLIFRQKIEKRIAFGAFIGICGIGLVFWPEIAGTTFNEDALTSVLLGLCGTFSFCLGSILSAVNQKQRHLPLVSTNAWGMFYGALWMIIVSTIRGQTFEIDWTTSYIGSLIWLILASSILAFAVYLTLVGRIGAARAGYATVVFPIFALLISTVIEDYQWSVLSLTGLVLVLTGNYFVLSRGHR